MFNYEIENSEYDNLEECVNDVYELASKYAIEGVENGIGGPFGAGIIYKKENEKYIILTVECNSVIQSNDPTEHAEINAIRKVCKMLNTISLENCILVSTAKSCSMCLSAACWANIPIIYYSEAYDMAHNNGFKDKKIYQHIKENESKLIEEKNLINPCCQIPFEKWMNKKDKKLY